MGEGSVWVVKCTCRISKEHGGVPARSDEVCHPYLDDNLVHSKTFDKHLQDFRKLLQCYHKHGVKLTPRKCEVL